MGHAVLSASGSHRWLNCTPSARLEQSYADYESEAAAEGTAAHALCEHKLRKLLKMRSKKPISQYDCDEMDAYTDDYVTFVSETLTQAKIQCKDPITDAQIIEHEKDGTSAKIQDYCNNIVSKYDSSSVVTRIMPTASTADNQLLRLPEKYLDSSRVNNYPFPMISVEATGFKIGEEVNDTIPYPDEEACFAAMRQYVSDRYLSGADVPKLSLAVNFVDWKDITRYEKYKSLLTVGLGDDVTVEYLPFDIHVKLRVCAVSYNCLTDKYETLTIGERKISVVNSINSASQKIDEVQQEVTVTNQKVSVIDANVSDINSDDKLTTIEKSAALREWSSFASEKSSLNTQAAAFGITTELNSYKNAFQLLSNFLNDGALYTTGIPLWLDSTHIVQTTDISGTQYRQYFADYYAARNSLVQAITAKLKALADTAQNGVNTNVGAITTIDTTLVEIQTAADALTTQVTNISDEISNDATGIEVRLETAQSQIEQHAASISTKVESSVYESYVSDNDTKVQSMDTQLTTIEQSLSSIEFSVGHTGYRNLIKNSAGKNGTNFWTVTGMVNQLENTNISNNTISNSAFSLAANSSISQPFPLRAGYQHMVWSKQL